METVTVDRRFNGPQESGNGGYVSAVFAGLVDGPAEVSLRSPVPLDTPLAAEAGPGGTVLVTDGETLVARVQAAEPPPAEIPATVTLEEAREATRGYPAPAEGLFSTCFVCGRAREDSMEVFAGPVEGTDLVATPWTPPGWSAGAAGDVLPEFVWSVLDCPTYFALYPDSHPLSFLVAMSARVDAPVRAGEEHVVIAWPESRSGRKHRAGSAVLSGAGEPLAVASVLLVDTGG